jgi:DnaK suppressor protein
MEIKALMAKKQSLIEKAMAVAKKVITKPVAKKPVAKKPVAKKPVAKKPVAKKPVTKQNKQFKQYQLKANEKYMSKSQMSHFRKILNEWKLELSNDIDRTVNHMQTDITAYADPNDRASQESDMALELRNRDRERKLVKKIDSTLGSIEQNEYGYCNACGEEIGLNRLLARPTASLCIDCKTLEEIKEKQLAK